MSDPGKFDELARRRLQRRPKEGEQEGEESDEPVRFSWSDTFAMIIAAYQVLLPMLLAMVGALVLVYLLFIWAFD